MRPTLVMHCNAGGDYGMGHLMRCLAIAEEANARGWFVTFSGSLAPAACDLIVAMVPGATLVPDLSDVPERDATVLHIDSYWQDADEPAAEARSRGWLVSNMQDGPFGVRPADLAIDPNLLAEDRFGASEAPNALLGASAIPIRRQVLRQRSAAPPEHSGSSRVLVVIGGTDPSGMAARVVAALRGVSRRLEVTVVASPPQDEAVLAAAETSHHRFDVVPFLADLPAVARRHDLVITAAGTTVWDLACIGVPMALLCVADNQEAGYAAATTVGLGIGLGKPPHGDLDQRVGGLDAVLGDDERLASLAHAGRDLIDGRGAWRIVSAWEQLLSVPPRAPDAPDLTARPATMEDASTLLAWRNDPRTRDGSRSPDEVAWGGHVRWLSGVLESADRQLYVVESGDRPVGTVRWDHLQSRDWEVSITVAPSMRGQGIALPLLRCGELALQVEGGARLVAAVHVDNVASRRLFERAGYLPLNGPDENGFATSSRWRAATGRPTSVGFRG